MDDSDDQWKHRPTRMRVEYVDGGESSIHSSSLNSSRNSSGEDGSPNSLPEVYEPHIPPFELIDRTNSRCPPSISSSSSTTTSSGELFQIEPREVIKKGSNVGDPSVTVMMISTKDKEEETSSEVAPTTRTEISREDDEFIVFGELSPTQSPPVQVMNRSSTASHDPHRIPATVFEPSTSIAAADWSNASNDSLFSIRLENGSFAKDRIRSKAWRRDSAIRPKRELTLTPDRWSKPRSSMSSQPSEEVATNDKVEKIPEEEMMNKSEGDCPTVVDKGMTKIYPIEEAKSTLEAESVNLSDKNNEIGEHNSFDAKEKNSDKKSSRSWCLRIFPCLTWPSWCFNTCCRPLCCCSCKWPSCKCRSPSCNCCTCSLAFCFCEHPCFSSIGMAISYICRCKPLTVCCVTELINAEHVTEEQSSKKGGGCCSCFSCGSSCCSCTSCLPRCSSCFSCQSCCSCNSCSSCFSSGSSCCSCKSCNSCFSCGSCFSCKSCSSCFSCGSCCSCKSCSSCFSCGSCRSCFSSCFSCEPCRSCFSCGSCSCSCFTCKCSFGCCSSHWWRPCRPHCC